MVVAEKKMFTVKDLILIITFVVGLASSFIVQQVQVNNNHEAIDKMQTTLESNNLELLNYKLEQLNLKQDEFINSFNAFLDDYYDK